MSQNDSGKSMHLGVTLTCKADCELCELSRVPFTEMNFNFLVKKWRTNTYLSGENQAMGQMARS